MEIVRMSAPGEHFDDLLEPDDEHPVFIPSDNRGRGGRVKNKHVAERVGDRDYKKKDR